MLTFFQLYLFISTVFSLTLAPCSKFTVIAYSLLLLRNTACQAPTSSRLLKHCNETGLNLFHSGQMIVNVHVYSPNIPMSSVDCTIYTPGTGVPLGSKLVHLLQLEPIITIQHLSLYQVPITAGWTDAARSKNVCDTFAHDQQWASNTRPFDLGYNIQSSWPHACFFG